MILKQRYFLTDDDTMRHGDKLVEYINYFLNFPFIQPHSDKNEYEKIKRSKY